MANRYFKFLSLVILLVLVNCAQSFATHIRAGEITVRRVDPQRPTYEITVTGYADTESPVLFGSNGILDYGDGTIEQINNQGDSGWIPRERVSEDTWKYELVRTHTYPGQKTYQISFRELYRNEGVLNMDNSVNMPFYIETVLVIDSYLGVNNTPQLLVPPVDKAAVGKIYVHNPGAFDADGDSLSYRLVFCKQDEGVPVANYRFPDETFPEGSPANGSSIYGGEPTFTLDPLTGDLVWDSPGTKGEYNAAFLVEEWRKVDGEYYFMGYVTRDMQILVEDTDNEPPVLELPKDTCVIAGTELNAIILANDANVGDAVKIEMFGGVKDAGATFTSATPNDGGYQSTLPASGTFSWKTSCNDIQDRPYAVQFKATDKSGGVPLVDIQTWNITVVAPPPVINNLQAVDSRTVELDFNAADYLCGSQARRVQVWRRVDSAPFEPDACETGMPAGAGYELVSTTGAKEFPFRDNNNGKGLSPGATYCYRIVTTFRAPQGGESMVSEEVCVTMPAAVPMITNVSVVETDEVNGRIEVRWTPPLDPDPGINPPYTYDLYRSEGFSGGPYEVVVKNLADTFHIDGVSDTVKLNTRQLVYNYYVMLRASGNEVDSSVTASTVRLTPQPLVSSIELIWKADVPWSNQVASSPYHIIYRDRKPGEDPEAFFPLDTINVLTSGGFTYLDDGSARGEGPLSDALEYCYFVVTYGSYGNPDVASPLINFSQKICAQPNDIIDPCPPATFALADMQDCDQFIKNTDCSVREYENKLEWTLNREADCQDDIAYWQIYYSPKTEKDLSKFVKIDSTTNTSYVHGNLKSMAGLYYIVAVDRSGNLSEPSEVIKRDNCPNYMLPNVFTPNGDPFNGTFSAKPCPRFVESVILRVYNRWGKEVYSYNSADGGPERSISINWDGRDDKGDLLTPGTYYYHAQVKYIMLNPNGKVEDLRGWVQIVTGERGINIENGK